MLAGANGPSSSALVGEVGGLKQPTNSEAVTGAGYGLENSGFQLVEMLCKQGRGAAAFQALPGTKGAPEAAAGACHC